MPHYVDRECEDCGVILPANEMRRINESALSWYGSSSTRYRVNKIDLCGDCLMARQMRADEERRAIRSARLRSKVSTIGIGAGLLLAIGFGIHIANTTSTNVGIFNTPAVPPSDENAASDNAQGDADAATSDAGLIASAEAAIRDKARDPDSVAFDGEHVVHHPNGSANVCGKVNGNNGFGGKAGFRDFVWGPTNSRISGVTVYDPNNLGPTLSAWAEGCLLKGETAQPANNDQNSEASDTQQPAPSAVAAAPQSRDTAPYPETVRDAIRLNEKCQGDEQNLDLVCKERDGAYEKAQAEGWCFGDAQTPDAQAVWHKCDMPN